MVEINCKNLSFHTSNAQTSCYQDEGGIYPLGYNATNKDELLSNGRSYHQ